MADVNRRSARERGQVILITGLLVATTLLALVLLLNAVIYTENVATRGIAGESDQAEEYRTAITAEVQAVLTAENRVQLEDASASGTFGNLTNRVEDAITLLDTRTRDRWRDRGRIADLEYQLQEGLLVWQDNDGNFSVTGNFSANVSRAERFTLNVSTAELHAFEHQTLENVSETEIEDNALGLTDMSGDWELRLFNVSNGTAVTNGTNQSICNQDTFTANRLRINLTNESVNDVSCSGSLWGDNGAPTGVSPPLDVGIDNQMNVRGQYELVAEGVDLRSGAPNNASVVPDATLDLRFESAQLRYEATVSVEGEVP